MVTTWDELEVAYEFASSGWGPNLKRHGSRLTTFGQALMDNNDSGVSRVGYGMVVQLQSPKKW